MTDPDSPTAAPLRVLCVDDNRDAADSLGTLLGLVGFEVAVAHDATTALGRATGFAPKACVLDITMPGMDGCELAARLRAGPGGAGMLLVALTALGDYASLGRITDAGFDLYYTKPADPAELCAVLRDFARRGRPGAAA